MCVCVCVCVCIICVNGTYECGMHLVYACTYVNHVYLVFSGILP